MPEDAERKAPRGILDRLDRAVLRVRGDTQTLADATQALVMVRLHGRAAAEHRCEARSLLERDLVIRVRPRRVPVLLVAHNLGEMLDEVAASGDIHHLKAAAAG